MSKKVVTYLSYEWKKYLITTILTILFWVWITGLIVTPKKTERLNVFINDETILELNIYDKLMELEGIKNVNVDFISYENELYQVLFNSRGVVDTDILILRENTFSENDIKTWFKKLDLIYLENINIENIYYINEIAYGIYIGEEEIMFLNANSLNLGKMNNKNYENDLAIRAIYKLMGN